MPYPLDEFVSNKANVEYAIANYLHGADNMATDVWWALKIILNLKESIYENNPNIDCLLCCFWHQL